MSTALRHARWSCNGGGGGGRRLDSGGLEEARVAPNVTFEGVAGVDGGDGVVDSVLHLDEEVPWCIDGVHGCVSHLLRMALRWSQL